MIQTYLRSANITKVQVLNLYPLEVNGSRIVIKQVRKAVAMAIILIAVKEWLGD